MSDRKYIGITIGPILQTLEEAATPAALWFASSYFSDLTRRICQALTEHMEGIKIYSPYYSQDIADDDGVGKYHDRIIFSAEPFDEAKLREVIEDVKKESLENFIFEEKANEEADYIHVRAFLERYLQIHFVIIDSDSIDQNSLLTLSPYLDAMELMKTFPSVETGNPFRHLFEEERNAGLKKSALFKRIDGSNNQFINNQGNIRSITEIAACAGRVPKELKRRRYFAVVQADGDSMGKILGTLKDDEVQNFSKACLDYAEGASELVSRFGGMTIYAGGDDLLFLAPVANGKGKTVFELCMEISNLFEGKMKEKFSNLLSFPTVSFGVSIQYEKFPLYEALNNARRLLFEVAKKHCYSGEEKPAKNSMAIEVQKHSGQTMSLVLSNMHTDIFKKILALEEDMEDGEQAVTSVLFVVETYQHLLRVLNQEAREGKIKEAEYENAWLNLFDNADQKPAEAYIKRVCSIWYQNVLMCNNRIETSDIYSRDKDMAVLVNLLRIKKFFVERGED